MTRGEDAKGMPIVERKRSWCVGTAVLLGLSLVLGADVARAQQPPRSPPREVLGEDPVRAAFGYPPAGPSGPYLILTGLVPLGWSRDGKFAYVLEEETEAADCNSLEVRVQDLRDGRTLWHGAYGSRGENPEGVRPLDEHVEVQQDSEGPECAGRVDKIWDKYRQKWFGAWAPLGIEPVGRPQFRRGAKGEGFSLRVRESAERARNEFDVEYPLERRVELETRSGTSVLYRDVRKPDDLFAPLDLKVLGFVRSPFERRRMAVVLGEMRRGWEGIPYVIQVHVVGAELPPERKGAAPPGVR
jgi:hypothetical protein